MQADKSVSPADAAAARVAQAFADLKGGQLERARTVFADLMHDPKHGADAYRGLAAVAWHQQQAETAIQLLRMALRDAPQHPDVHADLALILLLSGRAEESLPHWDQRLRQTPTDAHAWHNYAKALAATGHIEPAVTAFEQALQLNPEQGPTYETYARTLMEAGASERAEAVWRRGLARMPAREALHLGLAELLGAAGRHAECLEAYRAGIAALPDSPNLHMGMGQVQEDFGDRRAAEACFRRALELSPGWAYPMGALLALLRGEASEDDLAAARAVLADPLRPPADHANVGYGLGKALDARGDDDGAFAAWDQANAARRRQIGDFDRDKLARRVDRTIAQFDRAFVAARRRWGNETRRPVFVLGMPRSGTTLVEQILSAHPDVYGYGELPDIAQMGRTLGQRTGTIQRWPESAASLRPETVRGLADEYLAAMQKRHATDAARLVDKAPTNAFYVGLINLLFPAATIVWCQRDPRDICVSNYAENLALSQKHATDLADLGFFYCQHMRMMRHWLEVAGDRIVECRYEDLIRDPEGQSRRLVEAVGLPWDERCLRFHESQRVVLTPSRWQVRSPIYQGGVGRWRRYEKHLGPLLQALAGEIRD